ncbi:MAG: EAL domain-containing protein, partial [Pseudomonadota bacterium]
GETGAGQPSISTVDVTLSAAGGPRIATVAVPVAAPSGGLVGVVELTRDVAPLAQTLDTTFRRLTAGVIAVAALIFLVPSLILVRRNQQLRRRDEELVLIARQDPLTGTLNRAALADDLHALLKERDAREITCGICFIDVDAFRGVNKELGHSFGDRLLVHVARILRANVRASDIVARYGGDEFLIVLRDVDEEQLINVAERIQAQARALFVYDSVTVSPSVSIGAHLSPPGERREAARAATDAALIAAKAQGRGSLVLYSDAMDAPLRRRAKVEAAVRRGIVEERFFVEYQPIFDSTARTVVGFEALLRLRDASGELIGPTEFVPVAEDAGLIGELGSWTLATAISDARTWPDTLFLSVNLSPVQFRAGDLVERIRTTLRQTAFPPHRLELEVTEAVLSEDEDKVAHQIAALKSLGIAMVLDDFGTGYSSLANLWRHRFDKIKIDRVFLEAVDYYAEKYKLILLTIVRLGQRLGLAVVVEGVETATHLSLLKGFACDQYQGFLLGRPMPAADALHLIGGPTTVRVETKTGG